MGEGRDRGAGGRRGGAVSELTLARSVVPDSIEPIMGWKALRILPDGRLASPQQDTSGRSSNAARHAA